MPRVKKLCANCGSENIVKDAWAEWDIDKQEWVLSTFFDDTFCQDCESHYNYAEEEELPEE